MSFTMRLLPHDKTKPQKIKTIVGKSFNQRQTDWGFAKFCSLKQATEPPQEKFENIMISACKLQEDRVLLGPVILETFGNFLVPQYPRIRSQNAPRQRLHLNYFLVKWAPILYIKTVCILLVSYEGIYFYLFAELWSGLLRHRRIFELVCWIHLK